MINQASITAVQNSHFSGPFIRPLYDSYCFSNIPATVQRVLTGSPGGLPDDCLGDLPRRYSKVALFFLDAFGWRFYRDWADRSGFLRKFTDSGVVSQITSQFPSTTAAHVTCIHTGQPVGASGIYEWFCYEPAVDDIICPLRFNFAGEAQPNTLKNIGLLPADVFPGPTIYEQLRTAGVRSEVHQHSDTAFSPASSVLFRGADVYRHTTIAEAATNVVASLQHATEPTYVFCYYTYIDTLCHRYGPDSPQLAAEIAATLGTLERAFNEATKLDDTLVLITADHGQTASDPATSIYVNQTIPDLVPLLRRNHAGRILAPAGSPRDLYLHVNEGRLDDAVNLLARHLDGRADVLKTADLMADGLFGEPSDALRNRIGDLVILPYPGEAIWWFEKNRHDQPFYGNHGGLTRDEMETILLAWAP